MPDNGSRPDWVRARLYSDSQPHYFPQTLKDGHGRMLRLTTIIEERGMVVGQYRQDGDPRYLDSLGGHDA